MAVRALIVLVLLAVVSMPTLGRAQTTVDVELVLAVDVSGSMDPAEHRLQRDGYVEALAHPEVIDAITGGIYGRVALTYVEWAGPSAQTVVIPWRLVDSADAARRFASDLNATVIGPMRGTSISGIIDYADRVFADSEFRGLAEVIDISGDGANNLGGPVELARDRAVAAGRIINGLPLMLRPSLRGTATAPSLDAYYTDCVIGGPGAFVLPVSDLATLKDAIRRKLVWDIAGRPPQIWYAQTNVQQGPPVDCFIGEKRRRLWDDP